MGFVSKFETFLTKDMFSGMLALAISFSLSYGFANPDVTSAYDLFPIMKQRDYAFIHFHKVPSDKVESFQFHWRNLARYIQQQEGYLYTKLMKSVRPDEAEYQFVSYTTWVDEAAHRRAVDKPVGQMLIGALPVKEYTPLLQKIVVNDSEYVPPEN